MSGIVGAEYESGLREPSSDDGQTRVLMGFVKIGWVPLCGGSFMRHGMMKLIAGIVPVYMASICVRRLFLAPGYEKVVGGDRAGIHGVDRRPLFIFFDERKNQPGQADKVANPSGPLPAARQLVVRVVVVMHRQSKLLEVIGTLHAGRR